MDGNVNKYLRVMKIAGLTLSEADTICRELEKDTLERLTEEGVDRRLIKPLLNAARMKNDNSITDELINELLDDTNFMITLGKQNGILR